MSNKKLNRYYVLSEALYNMLKKPSIDENKLNPIDKSIFDILKNRSLSTPEKFLMYSQNLSKQAQNMRQSVRKERKDDVKPITNEKKKKSTEQFTQTDTPPETFERFIQTTPKSKSLGVHKRNILDENLTNSFTSEDEDFERDNFRQKQLTEHEKSFVSLEDELFGKPFGPYSPKVSQPLRRSKRIQKQKMPSSFDEETEAAALEFAQEEFQDPLDRNYIKRMSTSPSLRIIEHKPSGNVLTVSLDDIVDVVDDDDVVIVDDDDVVKVPQKRKRKKTSPNLKKGKTSPFIKKIKKSSDQRGGGHKIVWENF